MCEVPRGQAPRLHRLGQAQHPQANLIPSDLPREGSAGITPELREESVEVSGFTPPVETPVAPP